MSRRRSPPPHRNRFSWRIIKTRAPKTLLDWARQAALQIHRWVLNRYIFLVADSAFAPLEFLAAVRNHGRSVAEVPPRGLN